MNEIRAAAAYLRDHTGADGRLDYSLTRLEHCVIGTDGDGRSLIHKNTLLRLTDPTWIPKPETMKLLQRIVDRATAVNRGIEFPNEVLPRGRQSRQQGNGACASSAKVAPRKKGGRRQAR